MKLIAEKVIIEVFENGCTESASVYEADENETIGNLLAKMQITGTAQWHYDQVKVIIRLVKENKQ